MTTTVVREDSTETRTPETLGLVCNVAIVQHEGVLQTRWLVKMYSDFYLSPSPLGDLPVRRVSREAFLVLVRKWCRSSATTKERI